MELRTRTDPNPDIEVTLEPFTRHGITVPAGFPFDGASAPRFLWGIVPPFKRTKKAAVIHDWMCKNAKNASDRKAADLLFHTMLLEAGLNKVRCRLGYWGVRLGALCGIGVHYKHWTNGWTR